MLDRGVLPWSHYGLLLHSWFCKALPVTGMYLLWIDLHTLFVLFVCKEHFHFWSDLSPTPCLLSVHHFSTQPTTLFFCFPRQETLQAEDSPVFQEEQLLRVVNGVPQHLLPNTDVEWPQGTFRPGSVRPPCDLTAEQGICLFSGKKILVPEAVAAGTVAQFNFNDQSRGYVYDLSGTGNHAQIGPVANATSAPAPPAAPAAAPAPAAASLTFAPGRQGKGTSAVFNGKNYIRIAPSASLTTMTKDFTVSMWVYLASSNVAAPMGGCPLFTLGENVFSIVPSRQLSIALKGHPVVTSRVSLRAGHWSLVTFSYRSGTGAVSLYLNGVRDLDLIMSFENPMKPDAYIGGNPTSQCSYLNAFIDDVKLTNRPADPAVIAAEAFPALGSVEPSFTQLGCSRTQPCNWEQARRACSPGYHVCSERELRAGAYSVARIQGWTTYDDALWTAEDASSKHEPSVKKVALCCAFE